MSDLYDVLGIPRDADAQVIKQRYRRLARKYHPDANPGDDSAAAKFRAIQDAYEVLSDPKRRAEYDRTGKVDNPRSANAEIAEMVVPILFEVLTSLGTESVKTIDVVKQIRVRIKDMRGSAEMALAKWERGIVALKEVRDRISTPDDVPNIIRDAVIRETENSEETIRRIKVDLDRMTRALAYLDKCSYSVAAPSYMADIEKHATSAIVMAIKAMGMTT